MSHVEISLKILKVCEEGIFHAGPCDDLVVAVVAPAHSVQLDVHQTVSHVLHVCSSHGVTRVARVSSHGFITSHCLTSLLNKI